MNFLAHIYLSSDNQLLTIGNFAGDGVRGKDYTRFPVPMQAGIQLHREIDTFTDSHLVVKQSKKRLHENYGHYSGVIVDIFYDHFLAKNWKNYCNIPLAEYVNDFYEMLVRHLDVLPERFKKLTPIMIESNWLLSYASIEGIQGILNGMNHRTKGRSKMNNATYELEKYYDLFEKEFTIFFDDLIKFSEDKRLEIEKQYNL
ncbi:ACP phosphodiesterase [Winogradskyella sp. SYSU M77433]|uniref:acyl carrier protein phosphodiesterase n=1 Tax=Winogradskyella sp. SYSU M77433 TaxID=3042722 RepID=UPI00247FBD0E|nr:ACP phosphodiesterase [Winogradskyella sp. SYSU M77433]MDH7912827.1 ACP phosphodiesterase [Winogradskyella sp. SYSU M77433]